MNTIDVHDVVDAGLLADIAARLDLRQPNVEAVESIAIAVYAHHQLAGLHPPFEGVVDVATGVGKTYIAAAAIDYFAALGHRNFAIITPGTTIQNKTVANFTPGHPRSLLAGMDQQPVVITSDNFASADVRRRMDDERDVKLFVFTVQALTAPTSNVSKRTHSFAEELGAGLYERLQALNDLVVFADEHHSYYSPAFSRAVRDLHPHALIGLTATPHEKTPYDQIVYRYPLAAAIADQLVKTPVIVGRRDDRSDPRTKLLDGARLLDAKQSHIHAWCQQTGRPHINAVMLVIAPTIEEADEYASIIADPLFDEGRWANHVLVVHSEAGEAALAQLDAVEEPDSPVRIVIAVAMLKEGWDVKNVYVLASTRPLVSELLTEQTLGRGLRLPWGQPTGIEFLDTLEVLAHQQYEKLLRQADVINQAFVDARSRLVITEAGDGTPKIDVDERPVEALVAGVDSASDIEIDQGAEDPVTYVAAGTPAVSTVDDRSTEANRSVHALQLQLLPRPDVSPLRIPYLDAQLLEAQFSLADITDLDAFRKLGQQIATNPDEELVRQLLTAEVVTGDDGMRQTRIVRAAAQDTIASPGSQLEIEAAVGRLIDIVSQAPVVPARKGERAHLRRIVDAFVEPLGERAGKLLSAYMDRAAARLIAKLTDEHRRFAAKPQMSEVVAVTEFAPVRHGRPSVDDDRRGRFVRGVAYTGWGRSMYEQVWFDSSTERDLALAVDDSDDVRVWVRLHRGDLPILWSGSGSNYHPDFLVVEADGTCWIVEAKADRYVKDEQVHAKQEAARRWTNRAAASDLVDGDWRYLLVSETDVAQARGSWAALKALADR